jgi:hypothetical protein
MVAEKTSRLAQAGERNPDALCENELNDLQAIIGPNEWTSASSSPESR